MLKVIKENLIFVIVVALLLLFAGISVYQTMTARPQKDKKTEQTSSSKPPSSSAEIKLETPDEKNYRRAKLSLEHPYSEATEEEKQAVATAFEEAIRSINEAKHLVNVKGSIENHLSMSQEGMTQTFAMALLVNKYQYQASKLEVLKSDNEDVVQFLIVLTKEGEENCYFVGNFNTTVKQIQLKSYIGGNIGGTFG